MKNKIDDLNNKLKQNEITIKKYEIENANLKQKEKGLYFGQEKKFTSKFNEFSKLISGSKEPKNSINSNIINFESKNNINLDNKYKMELNINNKENERYYNKIEEENKEFKKEISKFPFTLSENEYIILLIIMTKYEKIIFPLMCKNTDKFN